MAESIPTLHGIIVRRKQIVEAVRISERVAGPIVFDADLNIERRATNLGWLLRHQREVLHPMQGIGFSVEGWRYGKPCGSAGYPLSVERFDPVLIAYLNDGRAYACQWADPSVLKDWLDRPVFRGCLVDWNVSPNDFAICTIGGKDYQAIEINYGNKD